MITLLNDWAGLWSGFFLGAVVQNTVFLILVFVALYMMRKAPARTLALIAGVGVFKMALPPFLPVSWFQSVSGESLMPTGASYWFPFAGEGTGLESRDLAASPNLSPVAWLMLLWLLVCLTLLFRAWWQTRQLKKAVQQSTILENSDLPLEIVESGLEVHLCQGIQMPLTLGMQEKRIYVPRSWLQWSTDQRSAVLRHEMAHLQRRDGMMQAVEIFVQAVFFFHPLVRILIRRLRMWREMACDDLSIPDDPHARFNYSRFLLSVAQNALGDHPSAEAASASSLARKKSELLHRISYQMKEKTMSPIPRNRLVVVLVVLLMAVVPLSLVFSSQAQEKEIPPPPPPKSLSAKAPAPAKAPKAAKAVVVDPSVPPPPPLSITITLEGAESVQVNHRTTSLSDFSETVRQEMKSKGSTPVVFIEGDGDVPMGLLHGVQGQLRDLELNRITYRGEFEKAQPLVLPPGKAQDKLASLPEDYLVKVLVDGQGVVTINGTKVAGARISQLVQEQLQQNDQRVFLLQTNSDTTYGAFLQVLGNLKDGGATRIAVADVDR